jgi:DNA polymerase-3 subunit epsilon
MSDCFVAMDIETANQNRHSICQIGLVAFQGTEELWRWSTKVNPEEEFDPFNVAIHGIRSSDVLNAPGLPTVLSLIAPSLERQFVVSHTLFDYQALSAAAVRHQLDLPACTWLDSCAIAKRTWSALDNHKLPTLGEYLGLQFKHHDALADAYVCGQVVIRAMVDTGTSLQDWMPSHTKAAAGDPTSRRYSEKIEKKGLSNAPLSGHVVVLTGE